MNDSYLTVSGNVTADPILRTGSAGQQFVTFRVASTPRRFDGRTRQWVDGETTYLSVIAFNALAANVAASICRGQPVIVHGRVRARTWASETRQVTSLELQATSVGHNLVFGESRFEKVGREPVEPVDRLADPLVQGDLRALGEHLPRVGEPLEELADGADEEHQAEPTDPWARPVADVTGLIEVTDAPSPDSDAADGDSVETDGPAQPGAAWGAGYTGDPETDDYLVRRAG